MLLPGCATAGPWYYYESNLDQISVGDSKEHLLSFFRGGQKEGGQRQAGMQIRAARRAANGDLLEVSEVPLINDAMRILVPGLPSHGLWSCPVSRMKRSVVS